MSSWTPRQVALLAEMGLTVWTAPYHPALGAAPFPVAEPARPQMRKVADGSPGDVSAAVGVAPFGTTDIGATSKPRRSVPTGGPAAAAAPPPSDARSFLASVAADNDDVPASLLHVDGGEAAEAHHWDALRNSVAGCTLCPLCAGRTHAVFAAGERTAAWLVVGEPPGDEEDASGSPFAGKAGRLLDNMLRAVGVARATDGNDPAPPTARARLAHAVRCRPPPGQLAGDAEIATCRVHMARELALARPAVVLAMGRAAVSSLLRTDEPLGHLRGRLHMPGGLAVVVTYDPAYLLRNPQDKAHAWADLCLAAAVVKEADAKRPAVRQVGASPI